jgi:porin
MADSRDCIFKIVNTMRWTCRWLVLLLGAAAAPALAADTPPAGVAMRYTTEIISTVSGGNDRGTGWLGRLDVTADTGADLAGIPGLHAHLDLFLLHGPNFSDRYAGDIQTVSNIDAPSALRPFEAFIEAPILPNVRAKAGLFDLNSEFDVQSVGAPFLNSSFGIGPDFSQSGLNGPSIYPVTAPGLFVAAEKDGRYVRVAIFDAVAGQLGHPSRFLPGGLGHDGALLVGEIGLPLGKTGHVQFGGWRYTDRFDRIDGGGRGISEGGYALIEARLAGREDGVALRGWLRVGLAADKVNSIGSYVGGGATYGDKKWLAGAAIAHARFGDPARQADPGLARAETAFELTLDHRLTRWFAVQPDIQYVRHPSVATTVPDALVLALRFHFELPGD